MRSNNRNRSLPVFFGRYLLPALALVATGASAQPNALPHIAFIAGNPSHGYGEHEANAGGALLVTDLNNSGVVRATLHRDGWPANGLAADTAAVVLYMDGDGGHEALEHIPALGELMSKGVGLVALHFATHFPEAEGEAHFRNWLGGYYNSDTSTNPIWQAAFRLDNTHPVTRGVEPFTALDEFYFNIRFADSPTPTPVLIATPPDEAREHIPHPRRTLFLFGGSVPADVMRDKGREETIAWTHVRDNGGRSFGFTGGHYHWNWGKTDYRRLIVNGIAWAAGANIPDTGIPANELQFNDLNKGLDTSEPWWFDADETAEKFGLPAPITTR